MALISSSFGLAQVTPVERALGTEIDPRSFSPLDVGVMTGISKKIDVLHLDPVQQSTQLIGQLVDLQTYTLPAGTLSADGDSLEIELSGALDRKSVV